MDWHLTRRFDSPGHAVRICVSAELTLLKSIVYLRTDFKDLAVEDVFFLHQAVVASHSQCVRILLHVVRVILWIAECCAIVLLPSQLVLLDQLFTTLLLVFHACTYS